MGSVSRDRERAQLEHELRTDEYQRLLWSLQKERPFLRQFRTWGDVTGFMRDGTSTDPRKDEVLRPIFAAHAAGQDPRWRTILMVIFWPGLQSIHFRKRRWDPDPEELWHNIAWTFLEVLCRIDIKQRPDRLVQKVYNDTVHCLHDQYRLIWDRAKRGTNVEQEEFHALADKEEFDAFAGKVDCCINFATLGLREEIEAEIRRLREHVQAGRISEADYLLLVGTTVYRQSIADYARNEGLNYQTIRKRYQRAVAAVRRVAGER